MPPGDFRRPLVIGVLLINLVIIALVGISIRQSRLQYEERATITTQNLSQVIEEYVSGVIARIDVALLSVADESERQLAGGSLNRQAINTYLVRQRARIPELLGLRITNAKGEIVYGTDLTPGYRFSVADRNYFIHLRDDPKSGIVISEPIVGRVVGKWIITMARRLKYPDGSFAGVVYGTISLERFAETFSRVNVGKHGVITLFNNDRKVLSRYTPYQESSSVIGKELTATELLKLFKNNQTEGMYRAVSTIDGIERIFVYRKISGYPLHINIGLAMDDYLAEWRNDVAKMLGLVALIFLVTLFFAWMLYRHITERKRAEEFRTLFDNAEIGMFRSPIDGSEMLDMNQKLLDIIGMTREEAQGKPETMFWADPKEREEVVRRLVADGRVADFECKILNRQSGIRNCLASAVLYPEQGVLEGSIIDITELKLAEEYLRKSENKYRTLIENLPQKIFYKDRNSVYISCNKDYADYLKIKPNEIAGRTDYDFFPKELADKYRADDKRLMDLVKTEDIEEKYTRKGEEIWIYTVKTPIMDDSGNVSGILGIFWDITERKKLEEQLRQSQKLEAIGTLAGGIAHDFNNLLQGVFGYISIAKLNAANKDKSIAALEQAEKALHMSVNLTAQLLTFSKGGNPIKKKISLQSVIENSVKFALSGSSSDYRIKFDADLWHVEGDEGQIGQVIQNIVLNADQAMPTGGTIVIAAKNVLAPEKGIPQLTEEGKYVEISVQDNGIGISEESLSKIFDPYFTTKAKGSGLGLATCYSIVKNHGGVIHVSSKLGEGTIFYVYLPAAEAEKEISQIPELSPIVGKGKILVMDDEEMVRDIAGEMIKALGHEVEFAEDGEAAVEKYKAAIESGNPFDIVILDLTIRGGMGGREAIERLLAVNSGVKAIVSSGYSDDAVVSDYQSYGFSARLTKPYKLEELGDTLNNLLGRSTNRKQ
jgi:PAS domain S-box-containing protein